MTATISLIVVSIALITLFAAQQVHAAIDADLITNLPGFGVTPTKQYSGLVPVDAKQTAFLHYWFVESSGNPSKDPVVVWLNGGPGCSSLEGYLMENGPFKFSGLYDSNGLPLLAVNPYSWSNIANMLYIESPAGVGFSYNVNGSTDSSDDLTSANNYLFLLNWFAGFKEFAANEFYISGESYAGMYVPTFADRILVGNAAGNPTINIKGFAVGNAVNGADYDTSVPFTWGLAMFSQVSYDAAIAACGSLQPTNPSSACETALNNALNEVGNIVNIYDVYDWCPSPVSMARVPLTQQQKHIVSQGQKRREGIDQVPDCIQPNVYGTALLDNSAVRSAIHVTASNLSMWGVCYGLNYNANHGSLLGQYPGWAKQLRILVFSGDVDGCVPHVFTEQWVEGLGFPVSDPFRPWLFSNGQVGGYVTTYGINNFAFLTVKGAGHMVPQYAPEAAFTMFSRWLSNSPY